MEADFDSKEEPKVGITQFISEGKQIQAITKFLLSDFIVNEIDKEEKLVTLTEKPSLQAMPKTNTQISFQINQSLLQRIKAMLGEQATQSVQKLYYQLQCGERVGAWEVIVEKELNKQERKALHDFVREQLHYIESQTLEGSKIKLKYNKNLRKMDPRARRKYTHFTLYKNGIDTFNALFRLSKLMGISQKLFSSAGLKDKRGHTTQRISVYNTDMPTLLKFYKEADRNREMWISDFKEFQDDKVKVGGLSGNQFGLILRLLNKQDGDESVRRVESLGKRGMINYFGLQRFGQFATKTYQFGILYAKREWKQLVQSIILSDCNNEGANQLKKQIYQSKKYGRAQRSLHNKYKIQKLLFRGLNKFGENYQNVFQSLPRSIKTLYTHSLQSYIWNKLASRRLKQFGLTIQEGDMVGRKLEVTGTQQKPLEAEEGQNQEIEIREDENEDQEILQIIPVTSENINNYSIADLVLPLFGPQTHLQEGTWLHKAVADELNALNLDEDDFKTSAKQQNSKSSWRRMIVVPQIIEHELISHSTPKQELQSPFYTLGQKLNVKQGDLRSLRVVIRLPKSAYATMAIRQMLHIPSEFQIQRQLNSLYEQHYCKND